MSTSARALKSVVGLAATLALASAAQADQALVVGVNKYPNLDGANLNGCVNDARLMGATLKQYGFQVTEVMDTQATKQGILGALTTMRSRIKPTERFVFYFAGHGTDTTEGDKAALLPHDAQATSADRDLKSQELYQAIRAIGAASRSVILDSCYSGGMQVSTKSLRATLTTRYYQRPNFAPAGGIGGDGAKDLRVVRANGQDSTVNIAGGPGVCYYSAARGNEQAAEDDFGGTRHGVFTYFLVNKLRAGQREPWGDVNKVVAGQVADRLRDVQHPTLLPQYSAVTIFDERGVPAQPVTNAVNPPVQPNVKPTTTPVSTIPVVVNTTSNLWDEFNKDNPDPARVQLAITPNKTTFKVGDRLSFEAKVGTPGYLVMVERGTSGKVNLLFPESGNAADAFVQPGKAIRIPADAGEEYEAADPGTERVKVFLFSDRTLAQAMLGKFQQVAGASRADVRDLFKTQKIRISPFYTSDFIFEVLGVGAAKPKP